ncbi:MAG: hypothetical protein K0U34_01660 [Alphaproteobacteria bacterium]|nr:hypothetical protein [Alphaproteobacteria bacterium]
MFGLTPRAEKVSPVPNPEPDSGLPSGDTRLNTDPSEVEVQLTKELEEVLAKTPAAHRANTAPQPLTMASPARSDAPDHSRPNESRVQKRKPIDPTPAPEPTSGAGFHWVVAAQQSQSRKNAASDSEQWLKRARRQSRWLKVRRAAQWAMLACAAVGIAIITTWPNAV